MEEKYVPKPPPPLSPELKEILEHAEDARVQFMRDYRTRQNLTLTVIVLCALVGTLGFAWLFLMQADLLKAILVAVCSAIPAGLAAFWKNAPLKSYRDHYKNNILPTIAANLGKLKYVRNGGIPEKVLSKTKIIPQYATYESEDCFRGTYKNTKILFSEARLLDSRGDYVFDGVFVMLELSSRALKGVSVLTSHPKVASKLGRQLKKIDLSDNAFAMDISAFTSHAQNEEVLTNPALIKELHEMIDLFDKAPCTLSFFGNRYVFAMIPYSVDMFEPSNIEFPIASSSSIKRCAAEIKQIQSIIDLLEPLLSASEEKS